MTNEDNAALETVTSENERLRSALDRFYRATLPVYEAVTELQQEETFIHRSVRDAVPVEQQSDQRLWVNQPRTVLVRLWKSGVVEVATRETPAHTWGPPTVLFEEEIP